MRISELLRLLRRLTLKYPDDDVHLYVTTRRLGFTGDTLRGQNPLLADDQFAKVVFYHPASQTYGIVRNSERDDEEGIPAVDMAALLRSFMRTASLEGAYVTLARFQQNKKLETLMNVWPISAIQENEPPALKIAILLSLVIVGSILIWSRG